MKKSELKALIREVIEEMNAKQGFTQDSINKLTSAGFEKLEDGSYYMKGGYANGVSIDTTAIQDTFSVSWSSEYSDDVGEVGVRTIEAAIEKALEQL